MALFLIICNISTLTNPLIFIDLIIFKPEKLEKGVVAGYSNSKRGAVFISGNGLMLKNDKP